MTDQEARDELAGVIRAATDDGADRSEDYADAVLEWMKRNGYRKHPEQDREGVDPEAVIRRMRTEGVGAARLLFTITKVYGMEMKS